MGGVSSSNNRSLFQKISLEYRPPAERVAEAPHGERQDQRDDDQALGSGTRRRSEDRINLTPTDRKPYRHSLKSRPHKGADSAIARRGAL